MKISVVGVNEIEKYAADINRHLHSVFNDDVNLCVNKEFFCAVIVENDDGIIASGLAYTRAMRQGSYNFTAAIIGNVAVKSSYRGQGLSKVVMGQLEQALAPIDVAYSFLFAYETNVYLSSGYSQLESPIRYFDTQKQNWNQFVYRGGMYKDHTSKRTLNQTVIEFGGCVY